MRRILVIGIGAGDPEHVTVQAIAALNDADVLFVVDKGAETEELVRLRREICERYIRRPAYRTVEIADPPRERAASDYRAAVEHWRELRSLAWERAIAGQLGENECGAFLVWGDPSLYDSTLDVLERILARGNVAFAHEVIPGITSAQALAARHRVALNRVGRPVQVTTGRRLAGGFPVGVDEVVVMLDADCSFTRLRDDALEIHWGAYVGMDDEILVSGPLPEVGAEIVRLRAEARERKGWIMDAYLLRRASPS
jgi:precorrin-6A synthase